MAAAPPTKVPIHRLAQEPRQAEFPDRSARTVVPSIGYAGKGMMKGYVAVPVRLPTCELTGYIGITEGKVPKEFHLSRRVTFPKKSA